VAAFPSRGEGFGLALLEAMAAGVPVVASAIPAHRELLGPGLEDRLIDFGRPDAAAAAIQALLVQSAAEQTQLSDRLRARARDYDMPRLVAQIEALYRQLGVAPPS
jgi:glycosyltransferase involved in cell wall biosynthesis